MGKAKRSKKNKRNNNKSKQSNNHGGPMAIPDGVNLAGEGTAGILGRIRHGDPRVRLGAMTALSATILDADSLIAAAATASGSEEGSHASSSKKKKSISDALLKAISERVLDPDTAVAVNAAGCISNYAAFSADVEENNATATSSSTRNPAVLGGLGEVLLGRISQCQKDITSYGQELTALSQTAAAAVSANAGSAGGDMNIKTAGNAANKMEKCMRRLEEQWTLAHLCLEGLAGLVERSPMALERFGGAGHRVNLVGGTIGISYLAGQFLQPTSSSFNVAAASCAVDAGIDEATTKAVSDAACSAARCMHSALDENPALLQSVLDASISTTCAGAAAPLQVLLSVVNSGSMPALARLHSAGALITARHLLPRTIIGDATSTATSTPNTGATASDLQSKLNEMDGMLSAHVLPLLTQYLQYQPTIAAALIARISSTQSDRDAELEDVKVERDVQKAVEHRKESARSIARRQKVAKEEKNAAEQAAREAAAHGSAAAMMEDSVGSASISSSATSPTLVSTESDQKDESDVVESAEDLYDRAVKAWRASCLPLMLAVEVAANLCAGSGPSNGESGDQDVDEGDDMMWDSDDETDLIVASARAQADGNREALAAAAAARDEKLFGEIVRLNIPTRAVEIVRSIISSHAADASSMPEIASDDLVELLSKCGVCGGNAAGSIYAWAGSKEESKQLWSILCGVARTPFGPSDTNDLNIAGKAAAISIMLALLRNRPGLISSVGEEDLKSVLALLLGDSTCTDARRDCVALLGVLCSESHPAVVNGMVCDAFLSVLAREDEEVAIISEILDAIMDVYSADDGDEGNHEATFRQKNVLAALKAILPNFKRRITLERGKVDAESFEMLMECALNTKRFIAYKSGK